MHGIIDERNSADKEKGLHLRIVEAMKELKNKYNKETFKHIVTICFDLLKMMPTSNVRNSQGLLHETTLEIQLKYPQT